MSNLPSLERLPPSLPVSPSTGTLSSSEFFHRFGLLGCALAFLLSEVVIPFHAPMLLVGLGIAHGLLILMATLGWRTLGDWRLPLNQILLIFLGLVVTGYVSALWIPQARGEESTTLILGAFEQLRGFLEAVPGGGLLGASLQIALLLVFLGFVFLIITSQSLPFQRAATVLLMLVQMGTLILLYQSVELFFGAIFLAYFLVEQWQRALVLPPLLEQSLKPLQKRYLQELLKEGSLSTGQTRVYLEQQAPLFGELLEHQLVEVDSIAREVFPGKRLNNHPAIQVYDSSRNILRRGLWIIAGLLYLVLPDLLPFTFLDDVVVLSILSGIGLDWGGLFGKNRTPSR